MMKIFKQIAAMMLAITLAATFIPVNVQAAGAKVTIASSGKVGTAMYKGAKARTASFKMTSTLSESGLKLTDGIYDVYEVNISLNKAKLSKNDIKKTVLESEKKGGHISDYTSICVDAEGNSLSDIIISGGLNKEKSSNAKNLTAKIGRNTYYIYGWRKNVVYSYKVYVPQGMTGIHLGFAGLRNGQLKGSTEKKYESHKINYYSAGFGKNKNGFAIAGAVN
ncbi:hypothetical protein [Butyrivibrio sp. AE3004]|uniref:hypothetical protein n=1 Tax=Butyrivibrio sp. AE3004 TaxID=1506994 RepID=UPI0004944E24|nr:hypothetical protein [Butyrivibrio sp. AE3004]